MFTASAVDRLFSGWARLDSPGAVVAVTRHGEVIHEGAYGMADLAHGVPLDRRSVIRIGSQSKQFTVLLALMLAAEGKLSMAAEVHDYAPWLPEYPHRITLHHLATNTSGLRDFLEMSIWSGLPLAAGATRQASRDLIAGHGEVNFVPGTQMLYSNTGFFLLSEIIEEVSGRSFNELLAERITRRLGMADTRLLARDTEILPRLVNQHQRGPGGWETVRWGFPLGGEGGMVSTLADMVTWQAALAKPPVEWAGHLGRMIAPLHYTNGTETLYRMGLVVDRYRGIRGIGHGGGVAGGKSESIRFPDQGLGVVILGNLAEMNPFSLARRIADVALDTAMVPAFPSAARERLGAAAGLYREEGGGEVFAISASDGVAFFTSTGGSTQLDEIAPGVFAPERPTMHLTLSQGADATIIVTACGVRQIFRRVAATARPRDLSGRYANTTLGLDARIDGAALLVRSDVGALRVDLVWIDDDLLLARAQGTSSGWMGSLRVIGDGFVLTTDRTKGLVFRAEQRRG